MQNLCIVAVQLNTGKPRNSLTTLCNCHLELKQKFKTHGTETILTVQ